jgi:hypothetical protein
MEMTMEQKEVKQPRYCGRCKNIIRIKDNYCRLTEWKMAEQVGEMYYHTSCFRESIHGNMEEKLIKKRAFDFMEKANKIVDRLA